PSVPEWNALVARHPEMRWRLDAARGEHPYAGLRGDHRFYGRKADYVTLSTSYGPGIFGLGLSETVTRYGQRFMGPQLSAGKALLPFSASTAIGWLDQPRMPTRQELFNFETGWSYNLSATLIRGVGTTYSSGGRGEELMWGTPGAGISASFMGFRGYTLGF